MLVFCTILNVFLLVFCTILNVCVYDFSLYLYALIKILLTIYWFFIYSLGSIMIVVSKKKNCIVAVLISNAVDCGFEPRLCQTKDYEIGICCFSAKHTALRSKSKDWLAWNQNNVSEWGDMSIPGLLFQWASTIKIQLSVLV